MRLFELRVALLLFLCSLFLFLSPAFAEKIILKSGKVVNARILQRTDAGIKVDFYGVILSYPFNEIQSIDGQPVYAAATSFPSSNVAVSRDAKSIFRDISPAVVYITTRTANGEEYLGSGFIVHSQGVVVTNYHVVSLAKDINVMLKDGTTYPVGYIVAYDALRDFCILKINETDLSTVALGDSNNIETGESIYCIGNPLGLEYSFSSGMLSGTRQDHEVKYLQFTAPISPGNSGGPLLDSKGQVIGIVTFCMVEGQNLNFALGINEIKPYITTVPLMDLDKFVNSSMRDSDYHVSKAGDFYRAGNFAQALSELDQAIKLDPGNLLAYLERGIVYFGMSNYAQALDNLNLAIQIYPNADAYDWRGTVYEKLNRNEEALADYNRAIQLNPQKAIFYNNRGFMYHKLGDVEKTLSDLNRAIELDPGYAEPYNGRGNVNLDRGRFDQALADFNRSIQLDPAYGDAYVSRACLYLIKHNYDQAISDFNSSIQIDPKNLTYYLFRAMGYYLKKEYNKYRKDLEKINELGGSATEQTVLGQIRIFETTYGVKLSQ